MLSILRNGFTPAKLASLGAAGLLAVGLIHASPAKAVEYEIDSGILGGTVIFIDSSLSAGVSMRVQGRKNSYLPEYSGGPNARTGIAETGYYAGATGAAGTGVGVFDVTTSGFGTHQYYGYALVSNDGIPYNYAGGVNTDAGRLNFDNGDLIGAPVKLLTDITASRGRFTLFARVSAFYDAVLADKRSYNNNPVRNSEAIDLIGRDIELLDVYLSGDFDIGDYPLNLRVGKQVINWGESTFYLSGNSVAGSVDLNAARRAGAELKEILLPENAVYASLGLPWDLTVEAYWLLDATPYELDPSGTPFSGSDVAVEGNRRADRLQLSGSARTGSFRFNCTGSPSRRAADALGTSLPALPGDTSLTGDAANSGCAAAYENITPITTAPTAGGEQAAYQIWRAGVRAEADALANAGDLFDYRTSLRRGYAEDDLRDFVQSNLDQLGYTDRANWTENDYRAFESLNNMPRLPDLEASEDGQYGIALRWYSESLNSTEFGFYYQNVHSKIPFAEAIYYERPIVTVGVTGVSSIGGSLLNGAGCDIGLLLAPINPALLTQGFLNQGGFLDPQLAKMQVTTGMEMDPRGEEFTRDLLRLNLHPVFFREGLTSTDQATHTGLATKNDKVDDQHGIGDYVKYAKFADKVLYEWFKTGGPGAGGAGAALYGTTDPGTDGGVITTSALANGANRFDVARINCAIAAYDSGATKARTFLGGPLNDAAAAVLGAVHGAEFLSIQHRQAIRLYYPEDIEVWGFSFATTLGDWGIQGDLAWRTNQPLAVDFTEQIIVIAGAQGVSNGTGDSHVVALTPLGTTPINNVVPEDYNPAKSFYTSTESPVLAGFQKSVRPDLARAITATYEGCDEYGFEGTANTDNMDQFGRCHSRNLVGGRPVSGNNVSDFRTDVYSFNLSAVNTFTASNGVVDFLGGDFGVVLAEVGFIYAPDIPDSRNPDDRPVAKHPTLAALCRSGSELPLGGVLNLDPSPHACSPDSMSWGYTILTFVDHSRLFETAWNLRTQVSFSHGVSGNTPSPFPGFRENAYTAGLSFTGTYQNEWQVSLSYTNYFGNSTYQGSSDRDYIGFSAAYSF